MFAQVINQANCASWACHLHSSHPVETDRPREWVLSCQRIVRRPLYIGLPGPATDDYFAAGCVVDCSSTMRNDKTGFSAPKTPVTLTVPISFPAGRGASVNFTSDR